MIRHFPSVLLAAFVCLTLCGSAAAAEPRVDFNRDIRPLLSDRCFQCHGPGEEDRQAGLRLDDRKGAVKELESGETAIVPGKAAESELFRRITSEFDFMRMPPPDSGKSLSKQEIELLRRWIDQGAKYQGHWAFLAPQRPELPKVSDEDAAHVSSPIDRFIVARLREAGLSPSPEADRRTLIRRVTLDLTGLPPTPAEIDRFLADDSPHAYEKLVDRLLASPHYGEHMARDWLDAARYGDTHGLHLDNYREIWPYRDWVIRAFNENEPYDEFTIEQLAGDLLPEPTFDQLVATGFNRCNPTTNEGGSIAEEFLVRNVVDRVETTSTVFLGLTTGCAACHDHKFDPITQKDFYSLFAFFNNLDGKPLDGNKEDHAPVVRVPTAGQKQQLATIDAELKDLARRMREREASASETFEKWLVKTESQDGRSHDTARGLVAHFPLDETEGQPPVDAVDPKRRGTFEDQVARVDGYAGRAVRFDDGTVVLGDIGRFERNRPFGYGAWIRTPGNVTGAPLARMDDEHGHQGWDLYVTGRKVAMHLIHRWPNDALKVTTQKDVLEPKAWQHVFVTYDGSSKATGVTVYVNGESQDVDVNNDALENSTVTDTPLRLGRRSRNSPFTGGMVDDVRIYDRLLTPEEVAAITGSSPIEPILALPRDERSAAQQARLLRYYLETKDEDYRKLVAERSRLESEKPKIRAAAPTTLIFRERKEPRPAYLLIRGEYDKRGDQVPRATPAALPSMNEDLPRDRLGFAKWLVDPDHPLTARVEVNRLWQHCFGTGIVKTSEDFGSQGEWPSHPRLLDWLAVEFRESGWDVKRTMKSIVMSATYRQSSNVTPKSRAKDPENRLLARGPRFRLDAEVIRDQALAVSGLLVPKIGGPSVKPPQPAGLWKAVGYTNSNTANFRQDQGKKIFRRSLYTFWKRTSPPPPMRTLDAPSRESCRVRRERTNTPLQALLLMNEVQFVEAARHVAQRTLKEGGTTPKERIGWMFELVTCREPSEDEREILLEAYRGNLAEYRANPDAATKLIHFGDTEPDASLPTEELAAWTMTANVVLNLDEVVTKD